MSEPTNEELRQSCERILDIERSVSANRGTLLHFGTFDLARFALSRLDREAEAERLLKVVREAIEKAPCVPECNSEVDKCEMCGEEFDAHPLAPLGFATACEEFILRPCDCWKSRALAEIAPAAPEFRVPKAGNPLGRIP